MKQLVSNSKLLNDIIKAAETDAAALLDRAKRTAEETLSSAGDRKARLLNEAEDQAAAVRAEMLKNSASALNMIRSRQQLKSDHRLARGVKEILVKKLEALRQSGTSGPVLKSLIIEGALALDGPELSVNGGERERMLMTEAFLKETAGKLRSRFGRGVTLKISADAPLGEGGVEMRDQSGRQAFRNTFAVRQLRYDGEIREIVQKHLGDSDHE